MNLAVVPRCPDDQTVRAFGPEPVQPQAVWDRGWWPAAVGHGGPAPAWRRSAPPWRRRAWSATDIIMLRRRPRCGAGGLRWPVSREGGARHLTPRPGRKGPWARDLRPDASTGVGKGSWDRCMRPGASTRRETLHGDHRVRWRWHLTAPGTWRWRATRTGEAGCSLGGSVAMRMEPSMGIIGPMIWLGQATHQCWKSP